MGLNVYTSHCCPFKIQLVNVTFWVTSEELQGPRDETSTVTPQPCPPLTGEHVEQLPPGVH